MNTTKSMGMNLLFVGLAAAAFPQETNPVLEDPEELARAIAAKVPALILVDVRSAAEYEAGHIPTASNTPHTEIADRPPTDDKNALIVLYCRSGSRSSAAKLSLERLGYTNVVNFGSIMKWRGPLVTGSEPGSP